jgi:hypothetical protein
VQLTWSLRDQPLPVEGCWAEGAAVAQLQKKMRPGLGLRAVSHGSQMVVLGCEIPWVDGLIYLGRVELLYLPTLWQPDLPYEWLLARLGKLGHSPWALVPPGRALGLSAAAAFP